MQNLLDFLGKFGILKLFQCYHIDWDIFFHVFMDIFVFIYNLRQRRIDIFIKRKLYLLIFGKFYILDACQKFIFRLNFAVIENFGKSITDNWAHLVLFLSKKLTVVLEFFSNCIVKIINSSLEILNDCMFLMFKLIHYETHIEETSWDDQVHHLDIFTFI